MYFTHVLVAIGLLATSTLAAEVCEPGVWGCGNQRGVPGPDGAIYVCNSNHEWQFSAQCGGVQCCKLRNDNLDLACWC